MAEAILDGLDGAVVEFCRFARANGLLAGVKETLGALEATKAVGIADRETLKTALADLPDLERLTLRLFRQMSQRLSRRRKVSRLHDKVDLRRTIRLNISRGGDPIFLSFKAKKLQQQRLVILLDVSGSMNPYSLFLPRLASAP